MTQKMKESEAWKVAQHHAQVTRHPTKIVALSPRLAEATGQVYAFTVEAHPIEGKLVGVVMPLDKQAANPHVAGIR